MVIINNQIKEVENQLLISAELLPPNICFIVLNLNIITTEVDLIFEKIAGQKHPLPSLVVLFIR
jgi:hypothetical protein